MLRTERCMYEEKRNILFKQSPVTISYSSAVLMSNVFKGAR